MPDKWEYPWLRVGIWHFIDPAGAVGLRFCQRAVDTDCFASDMHPMAQAPGVRRQFSDVNPPVHAWAAWRVDS